MEEVELTVNRVKMMFDAKDRAALMTDKQDSKKDCFCHQELADCVDCMECWKDRQKEVKEMIYVIHNVKEVRQDENILNQ